MSNSRNLALLSRHGILLTLIGSLGIVLAALAYEQVTGLLPCHLCWLQRGVFIGLAALSLIALLLQKYRLLLWPLVALFALFSITGIGVALRHLYIKMNPETVSCGMDVETLLDFFPLQEAITQMLIGSSDCAQQADFLGLPLPSWSLAGYLLLGSLAIYSLLSSRRA
ncbi:disulfide bond formation protein B [Marinospirillum sp.]|uniref:disulfide bond formation protein B n=1 Tax=Marinospirillum sp. TaxID=2183934 RepID=UPI0038505217